MNLFTERLLIRDLSIEDQDALFQIYSDKEAMRFRGSAPFENKAQVEEMLHRTFRNIAEKKEFRYAVALRESPSLIGTFLIKCKEAQSCEIGYSIGKAYWKKGYAIELLGAMLTWLKDQDYKRIQASSHADNLASTQLLLKAGFVRNPSLDQAPILYFVQGL